MSEKLMLMLVVAVAISLTSADEEEAAAPSMTITCAATYSEMAAAEVDPDDQKAVIKKKVASFMTLEHIEYLHSMYMAAKCLMMKQPLSTLKAALVEKCGEESKDVTMYNMMMTGGNVGEMVRQQLAARAAAGGQS